MDLARSQSSITFGKSKGCFLSRGLAFFLALLFVGALVLTGLLVFYLGTCSDGRTSSSATTLSDTVAPPATSTPAPTPVKDVRLPTSLLPDLYTVRLMPFIQDDNFTIAGQVWLLLNCTQTTRNITLHIQDITIHEADVQVQEADTNQTIGVVEHKYDEDRDFYIVMLDQDLEEGKQYRIYIPFTGELNDKLRGFYRSKYTDSATNETRWLATTQFQPTDARRAFPCMDEPALKARFQISLARTNNHTSISNMQIQREEPVNGMPGWTWDHYQVSLPLSTYLVAFVVSDFANRSSDPGLSKIPFRVWAREDAIAQAEYARNIGPRILEFFESYFKIDFPLPKQDMIALPDFSAGAMENWGLITFRETAMLYDEKVSSAINKQRVATVISHELAHQWFGNLVTPRWWTDLWLNEGFASYVEYLGVNEVEPDWKILEQFVTSEIHSVFGLDALESSHPISIPVGNPDEINEIFDRISYGKGASLLRMMNYFLTEKTFRDGLHNYLENWKFKSTEQDDLWSALSDQAHADGTLPRDLDVKEIMDTWTIQMGFPVINVTRDYDRGTALVSQTRFLLVEQTNSTDRHHYSWWVPLSYTYQGENDFSTANTKPKSWMGKNETEKTLVGLPRSRDAWVLFNIQETGYYRVNYDARNWDLLVDQLQKSHQNIGVTNRAQLMDDTLNLACAGLLPYEKALEATKYLRKEKEFLPWDAAFSSIRYLSDMLLRTEGYGLFKVYVLDLLKPLYNEVGFDKKPTDGQLEIYNRVNLLTWACSLGMEDCVRKASDRFQSWMNQTDPDVVNPVPVDLKRLVYCTAIKHGGEQEWEFAWQRYQRANVGSEKDTLLAGMGCSREVWILSRYLNRSLSEGSGIRKQDGSTVFRVVSGNPIGHYLAFDFVRDKWQRIMEYYGGAGPGRSGIATLSRRFNTPFELRQMQEFQRMNRGSLGTAKRAVEQSLEKTEANIRWMKHNFQAILQWLRKNQPTA